MADIGSVILYVDESGTEHQALVTQVWEEESTSGQVCNIVYVSDDINKVDCNGRALEYRRTVLHQDDLEAKVGPDELKVASVIAASSGGWRSCDVAEVEAVSTALSAKAEIFKP